VRQIHTDDVAPSTAPLSQAIESGDFLFVSGQVPRDPETDTLVTGDIREQTSQCLENVSSILEAAGASLDDIVKVTVFVTDISDFDAMNDVYAEYMSEPLPARSAIEISELAVDVDIEIEAVAER
jgi:2-iminobutanoate/2-iminopropanoate deaminase